MYHACMHTRPPARSARPTAQTARLAKLAAAGATAKDRHFRSDLQLVHAHQLGVGHRVALRRLVAVQQRFRERIDILLCQRVGNLQR